MNLLLFFFVIIVSFIIVRIGGIAFELTGLDWSMASFQSVSCFTGTGFTTREAELITISPQRRRIASVLMILGNAGLVTLIATFANTLRTDYLDSQATVHVAVPAFAAPWINMAVIVFSVLAAYRIVVKTKLDRKFTDFLRARIVKNELIKPVSFEELLVATGGYGISQIEVCKDSPILEKTLMNSELREADITVLAIERHGEIIPNPSARTKICMGDKLTCFGKLENIRNKICVVHN